MVNEIQVIEKTVSVQGESLLRKFACDKTSRPRIIEIKRAIQRNEVVVANCVDQELNIIND